MRRTYSLLVLLVLSALVLPRVQAQAHFSDCLDGSGNVFNATVALPAYSAPTIQGVPLSAESEIAVFSSDPSYPDLCVGVASWNGNTTFLTVWGDDDLTPLRDGLLDGEVLRFRVWDSASNTEYPSFAVDVGYDLGDGLYAMDDLFVLGSLDVLSAHSMSVTVAGGWNLIGLPVAVDNASYLNVYPNAMPGTLFGFDGTYYQPNPARLERGRGYWLRFAQSEAVVIEGMASTPDPVSLSQGWNLIGGLSCSLPVGAIDDPGDILVPGTLYGFNGAYYAAQTLDPGRSYWVYASAAGQVTLACGAAASKTVAEAPALSLDHFSAVHLSDATGASRTLYFNGSSEVSSEGYALPPVPPLGTFDARFEGGSWATESSEAVVAVQASAYPLRIKATNLPAGASYTLEVMEGGRPVGSYALQEGQSLSLSAGTTFALRRQEEVPSRFAVSQNYPNPFNPETTIGYQLSEGTSVRVSVFDVLGKQVALLVSESQSAGRHEVVWEAGDAPSGVYFYAVEAGGRKEVRKMLLLK